MTMDIDELDRVTAVRGNGSHHPPERDTDPAPPMNAEAMLRDVVIPRLERLDLEAEQSRDREKRMLDMLQEIHAEMFRNASKGTT